MAFDSILVANRGEIACRVIRSARDLGLRTIAVYSDADRDAPHVRIADAAVRIGPPPVSESYLRPDAILEAAGKADAGAIHPGYGFLSENAAFAQAVDEAGLVFVGPPAKAIRQMGDKAEARKLMDAAGVRCVPGYQGDAQSDEAIVDAADAIGFPVMIKAAAGGGGRGMRLIHEVADLRAALPLVRSEAANAFGDDRLIVEKAILGARHVEVQIFADSHGHCIHLGERDCSAQRRHQKVVEEAPCPVVTAALRKAMGDTAITAARAVDYCGAGTVEFLLDGGGDYYFLEMNTRLQVEHPVTEMITGLDLVALQIAVAQGRALPASQDELRLDGHAIEARLYAEDPTNGFLPDTGRIALWHPAAGDGVRIDDGIATGQIVSPHYDPLLAKIVAWGETREIARNRLIRAVEGTVLLGVKTNGAFLIDLLQTDDFARGLVTTGFVDETYRNGMPADVPPAADVALAVGLCLDADQQASLAAGTYVSPTLLGWSNVAPLAIPLRLMCGGAAFDATATSVGPVWTVTVGGEAFEIEFGIADGHAVSVNGQSLNVRRAWSANGDLGLAIGGRRWHFQRADEASGGDAAGSGGRVTAPMPGLVIDIHVSTGQTVKKGESLAVVEAMKMQHRITAPADGVVEHIGVAKGDRLGSGDVMIEIGDADV